MVGITTDQRACESNDMPGGPDEFAACHRLRTLITLLLVDLINDKVIE